MTDLLEAAAAHRERLREVRFIAVTGSCGKTTTKDLAAAVLGSVHSGSKSVGTNNCGADVARYLLAVDPGDAFFVQELGAWGPGTLDAGIALLRPDIAVVTNLRNDHYSAFHGPLGAQAEKGKLVACLPSGGVAVLNWDDPLVRELAGRSAAPVLSFGRHPQARLRAAEVEAAWPEPLSFTVHHDGEQARVRTGLYGEHLLGSALAALAVGLACGVPLERAVTALAAASPTAQRMAPVDCDGITFIRDDFKAPADSLPEVLAFLRDAAAARKVAVFGRISDFPGRSRPTYTRLAREATAILDTTVFVGQRAAELWAGDARPQGTGRGRLDVFATVAAAAGFLGGHLRPGDLVLLKGSGPTDHLERVLLSRKRRVACWQAACGRVHACDHCELLEETA